MQIVRHYRVFCLDRASRVVSAEYLEAASDAEALAAAARIGAHRRWRKARGLDGRAARRPDRREPGLARALTSASWFMGILSNLPSKLPR